jgi:periplasmic protein TonB
MKKNLLIALFALANGFTFAQETEIQPKQESVQVIVEEQEVIYDIVDEQAEFPGGTPALKMYMAENVIYPQTAVEKGFQGKCFLQFVVTKKGEITDIKVKKGVPNCPECDAESIRMVKSMPKWIPAKINGKAVNSTFNLPVSFRLS